MPPSPCRNLLILGCTPDYELSKRELGDVFYQLDAGAVDILLVVDNSCSMQPYQQELASNFDNFLTYFIEGDVDYQIGVATTTVIAPEAYGSCTAADVAQVPLAGTLVDNTVVTPDTPDAAGVFSDLVNVGVCGAGMEMGLESHGMPKGTNKRFGFAQSHRPGATKIFSIC